MAIATVPIMLGELSLSFRLESNDDGTFSPVELTIEDFRIFSEDLNDLGLNLPHPSGEHYDHA